MIWNMISLVDHIWYFVCWLWVDFFKSITYPWYHGDMVHIKTMIYSGKRTKHHISWGGCTDSNPQWTFWWSVQRHPNQASSTPWKLIAVMIPITPYWNIYKADKAGQERLVKGLANTYTDAPCRLQVVLKIMMSHLVHTSSDNFWVQDITVWFIVLSLFNHIQFILTGNWFEP
jgi:hypothetical protein